MTPLEMKIALRILQAEVTALRNRVGVLESNDSNESTPKIKDKDVRKMCPHCGVKPNHFFHVKNCLKNKNNGETDRDRASGVT